VVPESTNTDERDAGGEPVKIPELEGFMTATDASALLGVTRQSINKKIHAQVFKGARRIGAQYIIPIAEVEAEKHRRDESTDTAPDDELLDG